MRGQPQHDFHPFVHESPVIPGATLRPVLYQRAHSTRTPAKISLCIRSKRPFRVLCGTPCYSGVGRAINVSSGGVLVSTEQAGSHHHLRLGAQVEMSFEWPAMLDGKIPLQLFAVGAVVRYTTSAFAATLVRYEFRTMNNSNQPHAGLAAAFGGCVEPKTNGRAAKS